MWRSPLFFGHASDLMQNHSETAAPLLLCYNRIGQSIAVFAAEIKMAINP